MPLRTSALVSLSALALLLASSCSDESGSGGSCTDACELGQQTCGSIGGQPAFQVCELGADGCLRLAPLQLCDEGQTCVDGACVAGDGCTGACYVGETRCTAGGMVETCTDGDGDGCGQYGGPVACTSDSTCIQGGCVAPNNTQCSDECVVEGSGCDGATLTATCFDSNGDGCLELTTQTCPGGQLCVLGQCEPGCEGSCTLGARHCAGSTPEQCADPDGDGCTEWVPESACGSGERCDNGVCVDDSIPCTDDCTAGQSRCADDDAEQSCGNYDSDDCLEWGDSSACSATEVCQTDRCESVCQHDCNITDVQCSPGGVPQYCWDSDSDPCLDWTERTPCGSDEVCQSGVCELTCDQECPGVGQTQCEGDTVQVCGDYDADQCREWADQETCASDQTCESGGCVCADACSAGSQCTVDGQVVTCADHDGDGCLELGGATACQQDHACVDGACQYSGCSHECVFGSFSCGSNGRRLSCADHDDDGCLEYGDLHGCPLWDQSCVGDACTFTCTGTEPCQGEVVFTEFMFDPAAATDANGEYIEMYNASGRALNLSGCTISDDSTSHTFGDFPLAIGQYAVIGRNAVAADNGGLDVDYVLPGGNVGLRNSYEDTVELGCSRLVTAFDFGFWIAGGTGVAAQLHTDRLTEMGRRKSYNWCDAVGTYGAGDRGSPGAPNEPCYGQVLYEDDLEISAHDNPHWSFGHTETSECNWEWGQPRDQGFYSSPRCLQEGGSHCLGTDMDLWHWDLMDYDNNWVQLTLDLSSVNAGSPLELRLDLLFDIHEDEEDDHGQVVVSTDGQSFAPLHFTTHPYTHPAGVEVQWSDSIYWEDAAADLSAYSGQSSVMIRFQMETDSGLLGAGFYVDNVRVLVP